MSVGEQPSILVPYIGAANSEEKQDVFVIMRPDTNGVVGEKVVMSTIRQCSAYSEKEMQLAYLANIPSDTLISKNVYQHYYALKLHFATRGGSIFTPNMKRMFSEHFNEEFDEQNVVGAFPALDLLSITSEELFNVRVDAESMITINGQSIKKYQGYFIVNYNIPALVHRYSLQYDIAVMCFRMNKSYEYFELLIDKMHTTLIAEGVIAKNSSIGSAFHYSYGPFDQLHDGISFLLDEYAEHIDLTELSFAHYLHQRGVAMDTVRHLLINPIVTIIDHHGNEQEVSITDYTRGQSYAEAYDALNRIIAYSSIDPLGLIVDRNRSPATPRVAKISATT